MTEPSTQQASATTTLPRGDLPAGEALPLAAPPLSSPQPDDTASKARGAAVVPEEHTKFAEEIHQYVREYIRNADQKATFFFAAVTAGLAYLITHGGAEAVLKSPAAFAVSDVAGVVGTAGLTLSAVLLLTVVFPRLRASNPGIIFFNAIAEHRASDDYAEAVIETPPADIARIKLRHAYDLAKVCRSKYRILRAGFWTGSVGAANTILYLALRAASHL